ncbi:Silenced mating-type M-specific polypeptide Mc like protein [Verticillium longisporum]|nr:Silenced mating-type M-specific polypeptide Mc like protein [Verticillium longisporum]
MIETYILESQHHQAQVVSEHPGLANPDISKIIGEQWRQQPDNVKAGWKKLAEEEKVRHQQQYPDYRKGVSLPLHAGAQGSQTAKRIHTIQTTSPGSGRL